MADRPARALLIEYYNRAIKSEDLDRFQTDLVARYTEGTLLRLLGSGDTLTRRAAALGLGRIGTMASNRALARALADADSMVRLHAEQSMWAVWLRADPVHEGDLAQARALIANERPELAIDRATRVIAAAPDFAEAYNQRAIANYVLGRYAASASDCRAAIERNPHHFGALGGLAQCQMKMGDRAGAIATLKRLLRLRPHSGDVRLSIEALEAADES